MHVVVNSEEVTVEDGDFLSGALSRLRVDTGGGTAIAVDGQVIPRIRWDTYPLEAGAEIVILKATQGG